MSSNKVIITCDSVCDLPKKMLNKHKIKVIPINVLIGMKNYPDDGSITAETIYKEYKENGVLPKTAAFSPQVAIDFWEDLMKKDTEIVHISLSSDLSSSYQNAIIAAGEFSNIHLVDSKNLSSGQGLLVLEACRLRDRGFNAEDIAEQLELFKTKICTSFVIDTLEFLHKGGRCSGLAAMGANVMQLKPCLEMREGTLKVTKKYRGKIDRVYLQYLNDKVDILQIDTTREVFLVTSGETDKKTLETLRKWVSDQLKTDEVYVVQAGSTVCSHCGPKTLGLIYTRN